MPPRHAYWTILVDDQPTAFRAADRDDLQPTFKRLQEKHPSARMVWFQNGKIWPSRLDAQEAMKARGERGRAGDFRQRETLSERKSAGTADNRESKGKLEWKPKGTFVKPEATRKLEWKPKGAPGTTQDPRPKTHDPRSARREGGKPEWKPKGSFKPERSARPDWKPKGRSEGFRPRGADRRPAGGKLEWKPKGAPGTTQDSRPRTQDPRRKWIPKEEYKRSHGSKPKPRDKNWRPGGEHRDPRQKYKDAKKAKWTRFKQTIRKRWEGKQPAKKKKTDDDK